MGDYGRISRQQQVLRAVLDEATDVNVVTTLPTMFTTLS
jgi:anionic cell wall polymer biosynthesis LytR-Cps2A-Psr (LCP) family protein